MCCGPQGVFHLGAVAYVVVSPAWGLPCGFSPVWVLTRVRCSIRLAVREHLIGGVCQGVCDGIDLPGSGFVRLELFSDDPVAVLVA